MPNIGHSRVYTNKINTKYIIMIIGKQDKLDDRVGLDRSSERNSYNPSSPTCRSSKTTSETWDFTRHLLTENKK